jgi:hypothetical protein
MNWLNSDQYCLLFDIPKQYYASADYSLATVLGTSFLWVPYVNGVMTTLALGLGVFIAVIRAYKAWKFRHIKDD